MSILENKREELWEMDRLICTVVLCPVLINNKINMPEEAIKRDLLREAFEVDRVIRCRLNNAKILKLAHMLHEPLKIFNDSSFPRNDEIIEKSQELHKIFWLHHETEALVQDFISSIASASQTAKHINKIIDDWIARKPVGLEHPIDALNIINEFDTKFK